MKRKYQGPACIRMFPHLYYSLLFSLCLQEIGEGNVQDCFYREKMLELSPKLKSLEDFSHVELESVSEAFQ